MTKCFGGSPRAQHAVPPVVDDPNKRETPPNMHIYPRAHIYACVCTRPSVPPTEPTVLRRQFGPNPPHAGSALVGTPCRGGLRPARRLSFLSCYQRSRSLSLPSLCPSLSLLSPPASPFAAPPDNVAFLLQILNTCCPTALSRRDMCSLLPGSSVCALAEVCIPRPRCPHLALPTSPAALCCVPACRTVMVAQVPPGGLRSARYIWTWRGPAYARAYIGIVSENPR